MNFAANTLAKEISPDGIGLCFRSSLPWRRMARPRRCSWAIGSSRLQLLWKTRSQIYRDPGANGLLLLQPGLGSPGSSGGEATFLGACSD